MKNRRVKKHDFAGGEHIIRCFSDKCDAEGYLMDTCLAVQDTFKYLDDFRIPLYGLTPQNFIVSFHSISF